MTSARVIDRGLWWRAAGALVTLAAWEGIGRSGLWGESFPALSTIAAAFDTAQRRELLWRSLAATAGSAGLGLAIGALLALMLVAIGQLWPRLHEGIDSLTTTTHAIPTIAFAPVLILIAGPQATPAVLSVFAAYFPILVALDSSLRFAPRTPHDLAAVLGAGDGVVATLSLRSCSARRARARSHGSIGRQRCRPSSTVFAWPRRGR